MVTVIKGFKVRPWKDGWDMVGIEAVGITPPAKIEIPSQIDGLSVLKLTGTFLNDTQFSEIIIPNSVTEINDVAFNNCAVEILRLGKGVSKISGKSVAGSENLKSIIVSPHSPYYRSINGNLYDKSTTKLIIGLNHRIEPSVEIIEAHAYENRDIIGIILPNGLKEIRACAFYQSKIESIIIPSSVNRIAAQAFEYSGLESLRIQSDENKIDSLEIDNHAFGSCELIEIILPTHLNKVGMSVFTLDKAETLEIRSGKFNYKSLGTPVHNARKNLKSIIVDFRKVLVLEGGRIVSAEKLFGTDISRHFTSFQEFQSIVKLGKDWIEDKFW